MLTYKELKAQMAELEEQAVAARQAEFQEVLNAIREKVREFGITARDIFGAQRAARPKQSKSLIPAKYRDPKTGATWSGRGRAPNWIKDVRNRDRFLIGR